MGNDKAVARFTTSERCRRRARGANTPLLAVAGCMGVIHGLSDNAILIVGVLIIECTDSPLVNALEGETIAQLKPLLESRVRGDKTGM